MERAKAMAIPCHHRQRGIALEPVNAVIRALVQPIHFERVDRGFKRRMRAPRLDEFFGLLDCLRRPG